MNGPVDCAGSGARKICAALTGFRPVLSRTSVPPDVKFKADVHITEHGVSGPAPAHEP